MSDDDEMDWSSFGQIMREQSKERRANNRENSAQILRDHGVNFDERNDGAHLIVRHGGRTYDFWPGTGKWVLRGTQSYRRGVFRLLLELGVEVKA